MTPGPIYNRSLSIMSKHGTAKCLSLVFASISLVLITVFLSLTNINITSAGVSSEMDTRGQRVLQFPISTFSLVRPQNSTLAEY